MTVGTQVKSCYYTVKQIEAGLEVLASKTTNDASLDAFSEAQEYIETVKEDLKKQIIFIENEESQYDV